VSSTFDHYCLLVNKHAIALRYDLPERHMYREFLDALWYHLDDDEKERAPRIAFLTNGHTDSYDPDSPGTWEP
jgi:hypothetical protein